MDISKPTRRLLADNKGTAATILGLAALAVFNTVAARRAERKNPPQGRFISVDGINLHYIEKGSGPPVVLLHGNQVTAEDFEISGVLGLVARTHRVIAFDRPGFGYSERPRGTIWSAFAQARLIHKALRQLGVEAPVIVGHSWGAMVALAHALDYPGDTGALLLLGGYYFPSLRLDSALTLPAALPVIGTVLSHTLSPLMARLTGPAVVKAVFSPADVAPRFKRDFPFSLAVRPSQISATAVDANLMGPDAARMMGRYRSLTLPVTIMAGKGDKIVSVEKQAERLHAMLPQSRFELLDGAGHMLHYNHPELVAEAVDALSQQSAAPAKLIEADQAA
jgi:pimeloyl-ACP methyl ester carboxylesterase